MAVKKTTGGYKCSKNGKTYKTKSAAMAADKAGTSKKKV